MKLDETRDEGRKARDPGASVGGSPAPALGTPLRRLLGVPLLHKLLVANCAVLVLGAAALLLTWGRSAAPPPGSVAGLVLVGLAFLAASAAANALLIRLALSPLAGLAAAARRVRDGEAGARAPSSPLADSELATLIHLFNDVLDGVEAERARRTQLALRVLQSEERERELVARELYSGTAQTLAGALVRMRVANATRDPEGAARLLEEVRDEVAGALEGIRNVARRLRAPELDELGVAAALEAHARRLTEDRPIRVAFEGRVPEARLSPDKTLALFRIVQEALSNAIVHSGGSTVRVRYQAADDGLAVEVRDDGCGFDADRTLFSGSGGLGLLGMRERAGYVAGTVMVASAPGEGTSVRLLVPWSEAPASATRENGRMSRESARAARVVLAKRRRR